MATSKNARVADKPKRAKIIGRCGSELTRVMVKGITGGARFRWYCGTHNSYEARCTYVNGKSS